MNATTHTTSKAKRNTKRGQRHFDYDLFCSDLNEYKRTHGLTHIDIYLKTKLSVSMIAKVVQGNYQSDMSVNTLCALCKFMKKQPAKYLKA